MTRPEGASGGPRGKRGRRRRVEVRPANENVERELTAEEWRSYHYGDATGPVHGPTRRAYPLGSTVTKAQLGLAGSDWNDPRYRRAYQDYVILSDGEESRGSETGEAVLIERDDDGELRSGIFLVEPGDAEPEMLNQALWFYVGADLKVLQEYDRRLGHARAWMTRVMKEKLEDHGFRVFEDGEADERRAWIVQPGTRTVEQLNGYLRARTGKDFEALWLFSSDVGFALVRATRKAAVQFVKRGFLIEEKEEDELPFRVA